jgi:hypothetical protein
MFDLSADDANRIESEWIVTALKRFLDSQRGVKTPPDYIALHVTARGFAHAKFGYGIDGCQAWATLKVEEARRALAIQMDGEPKRRRRGGTPSKT